MKFAGYVASIVVLALLGAFTVSTLWAWFIVPFGLPAIGYAHAYGIAVFVNFFLASITTSVAKKETPLSQTIGTGILVNLFTLWFGWIAHIFM